MQDTSIDISDKLENGLVELYRAVQTSCEDLGIEFLVVGATARDIVLVHGFGANIQRGTRDIDFGIQVQNWDQFQQLKDKLISRGFAASKGIVHRLHMTDSGKYPWEIDIIPFGGVADEEQAVAMPPDHAVVMTVAGFEEALSSSIEVKIANKPDLSVKVATPASMLVLKLVAWLERVPAIRVKDAQDIFFLTANYSRIPSIQRALFENGYITVQQPDEHRASAMKLADDAKDAANPSTIQYLCQELFENEAKVDKLVLDMRKAYEGNGMDYDQTEALLDIIHNRFKG